MFGVPRFKHIYGAAGVPYLDSEDLFKVNPEITKSIPGATKRQRDTYAVKAGWLLMACSGQLYGLNGSVVLTLEWHEGKILSNHLLRIVPDTTKVRPGYLLTVLSHPIVGRPLVQCAAFGTEVPEIAPADVRLTPIPRLDRETEDEIANLAETSIALGNDARNAEDEGTKLAELYVESLL